MKYWVAVDDNCEKLIEIVEGLEEEQGIEKEHLEEISNFVDKKRKEIAGCLMGLMDNHRILKVISSNIWALSDFSCDELSSLKSIEKGLWEKTGKSTVEWVAKQLGKNISEQEKKTFPSFYNGLYGKIQGLDEGKSLYKKQPFSKREVTFIRRLLNETNNKGLSTKLVGNARISELQFCLETNNNITFERELRKELREGCRALEINTKVYKRKVSEKRHPKIYGALNKIQSLFRTIQEKLTGKKLLAKNKYRNFCLTLGSDSKEEEGKRKEVILEDDDDEEEEEEEEEEDSSYNPGQDDKSDYKKNNLYFISQSLDGVAAGKPEEKNQNKLDGNNGRIYGTSVFASYNGGENLTRPKDTDDKIVIGYASSGLPFQIVVDGHYGIDERQLLFQFINDHVAPLMDEYAKELSGNRDYEATIKSLIKKIYALRADKIKSYQPNDSSLNFTMSIGITYEKNDKLWCAGFGIGNTGLVLRKKNGNIKQLAYSTEIGHGENYGRNKDGFDAFCGGRIEETINRNSIFNEPVAPGDEVFGYTDLSEGLLIEHSPKQGSSDEEKVIQKKLDIEIQGHDNQGDDNKSSLFTAVRKKNEKLFLKQCEDAETKKTTTVFGDDCMMGSVKVPTKEMQNSLKQTLGKIGKADFIEKTKQKDLIVCYHFIISDLEKCEKDLEKLNTHIIFFRENSEKTSIRNLVSGLKKGLSELKSLQNKRTYQPGEESGAHKYFNQLMSAIKETKEQYRHDKISWNFWRHLNALEKQFKVMDICYFSGKDKISLSLDAGDERILLLPDSVKSNKPAKTLDEKPVFRGVSHF